MNQEIGTYKNKYLDNHTASTKVSHAQEIKPILFWSEFQLKIL